MTSLSVGNPITGLRYVKAIGDYYLFTENRTSSYALLDKALCIEEPTKDLPTSARIVNILQHKGKTVFVVTQKTVPSKYIMPGLVKEGDFIDVAFMQNHNGDWNPTNNNYWKLLTLRFKSKPSDIDYRKNRRSK